jgi:hypothetical protein
LARHYGVATHSDWLVAWAPHSRQDCKNRKIQASRDAGRAARLSAALAFAVPLGFNQL